MRDPGQPPDIPGLAFVRHLGSGGYADVFLYEQERPKRQVAVKVMAAEGLSDRARERFSDEANAMAELADHPNIVPVYWTDTAADGRPYLVMRAYPPRTLATRARSETIPVPEVLAIGVRISCAVETAHRHGRLHRDVKPANILTSRTGEPGLADFGISTTKDDKTGESEGMSIPWSPPEVLWNTSSADERSDVYSIGATLWHLLVGRSPFEIPGGDNTSLAMMRRIRQQPLPRTGREEVPLQLERLLNQTMAKEPADRPATALELAQALRAIELEQQWSPTPLVLLDERDYDHEPEAVDTPRDDDDGTRRHDIQVVNPEARKEAPEENPLRSQRRDESPGPDHDGRGRDRILPPEPELEGTRRRTVSPIKEEIDEEKRTSEERESKPDEPSGSRTRLALIGVGVLVVIAVAVGVVASSGGGGNHPSATTPTAPATTSDALDGTVGTPVVTGNRVGADSVRFTWDYANEEAGDRYQVIVLGGPTKILTAPEFTDSSTQKVCITVQAARADGSATSPISQQTCAG